MKVAIVFALLTVTAVAASVKDVDWSQIKPLHPRLPRPYDAASERITNGQLASEKEFPYIVSLVLYGSAGNYMCGGSLISDRYVVTAAHCTELIPKDKGIDVLMGAWNRFDSSEKYQQKVYVAHSGIIIHKDWDSANLVNDISLIKLPVPIEFNDYIQPIQLPKASGTYSTYAGEDGIASGWGVTSDAGGASTDKLQWIRAPIMTNSGCNTWFFGSIKASNICIKTTGGYSTCNGDSGGPLVVGEKEKTLVGITSFGIAFGCEVGWPGVFTRVTSYLDWIREHTGVYYV